MRRLFFVFVVGCSDSGGAPDAKAPDVNIGACGAIGSSCNAGCPNGFECINSACAPMHGSCGGFVGAMCQDTSLTCTYPTGNSAGICLRPDEKDCMCAVAPNALADCP